MTLKSKGDREKENLRGVVRERVLGYGRKRLCTVTYSGSAETTDERRDQRLDSGE